MLDDLVRTTDRNQPGDIGTHPAAVAATAEPPRTTTWATTLVPNLWIVQGIRQLVSLPVTSPPPKPKSSNRAGNHVNCARQSIVAISAALLLITLVGCSSNPGPAGVTTIVFDGQSQTLHGPISCTAQPNGNLVILATDTGRKTARVVLSRAHQLVVEKVGIRIPGASGFTEDSGQMWATKVDNTYQINGWMPPNAGDTTRHQFEIDTTCRYEVPPIPQLDNGGYGAP